MLLKKLCMIKLVSKVNNIDTRRSVLKTKYDTDKSNLQKEISGANKKIPDTSRFAKKQIIMLKLLK